MNKTEYFATQSPSEVAHFMIDKLSEWRQFINRNGLQRKWWKSYRLYYGKHFFKNLNYTDGEMIRTGEKGELVAYAVNHYRNLIKHVLALTVNEKPAYDCMAVNSDPDSLNDAKNGTKILDAYLTQKRSYRFLRRAAEMSQVFGKGFILPLWDPSAGRPYGKTFAKDLQGQPLLDDNGQPKEKTIYEGDAEDRNPSVFDVYVDQSCEDWEFRQWENVRLFKNKFDLAIQYPHAATDILALPGKDDLDGVKYLTFQHYNETADVPVYYFFHKKTHSLPNGRLLIYCTDDCILYDGPIPYRRLPLQRIVPGEIFGTTEGYSDAFDIMGIQEAVDTLYSIIFSNQQANGVQKIWVPEGGNISSQMLSKGLAILRGPAGAKPEPLNLTMTAGEIFQSIPLNEKAMETLSGINSVARGDPEALGKNASGIALAYVQAMAVQYNSMFQTAWAEMNEDYGTFKLEQLQAFATTERKVAMTGKNSRGAMKSFSGNDLKSLDRVVVKLGNPLTRTISGRLNIADSMLQKGLITSPQEYFTVMETGQLDVMTKGADAELDLIHKENDLLMQGKSVKAMVGDKHILHGQEHKALLDDPDLRQREAMGDPVASAIVKNTTDHIQEHNQQWHGQAGDPYWAAISNEPPAPPPPPPPPPMPPPGPPPGPQGPPPPPGVPPGAMQPHHPPGRHPHPPAGAHHPHPKPPNGPSLGALMQPPSEIQPIPRLPGNLQPPGAGMPPSS